MIETAFTNDEHALLAATSRYVVLFEEYLDRYAALVAHLAVMGRDTGEAEKLLRELQQTLAHEPQQFALRGKQMTLHPLASTRAGRPGR